jgi:hypothetical protein
MCEATFSMAQDSSTEQGFHLDRQASQTAIHSQNGLPMIALTCVTENPETGHNLIWGVPLTETTPPDGQAATDYAFDTSSTSHVLLIRPERVAAESQTELLPLGGHNLAEAMCGEDRTPSVTLEGLPFDESYIGPGVAYYPGARFLCREVADLQFAETK